MKVQLETEFLARAKELAARQTSFLRSIAEKRGMGMRQGPGAPRVL